MTALDIICILLCLRIVATALSLDTPTALDPDAAPTGGDA